MDSERKRSKKIERELFLDSDSDAYDEESEESENDDGESEEDAKSGDSSKWLPPRQAQRRTTGVHPFTAGPSGVKASETQKIASDSSPLSVFMLFFADVIHLLVVETNRYYHQYLDTLDEGPSPLPDVSMHELLLFLAITVQMGHDVRDTLKDYWSTLHQFHTPFFTATMKRDRFLHILRFIHFSDNKDEPDRNDENYDRLWKIRNVFEMLSYGYAKYYSPSENLAVDEVIVLFKGRVIFKQYIPRKHKRFGIKIYKLCDQTGYTYDMKVYLGKDRQSSMQGITAAHSTVKELTRRVEGVGHKLYMDNFFTSPILFDDLTTKKINCCGTVRQNQKDMPRDLDSKTLKLKRGDIRVRVRDDLTAMVWKDKRDVCMLTNIHNPPGEGNYRDECENALRPAIVEDYNRHMGYVDKGDRMANSYSISRRTWKWTKKLFFHLVDLTILNSWILLSSCGRKISHRNFRLSLVRDLVDAGSWALPAVTSSRGRPTVNKNHLKRLEAKNNKHWPVQGKRLRCRVCSAKGKYRRTNFKCKVCEVGLCIGCFEEYHTQ